MQPKQKPLYDFERLSNFPKPKGYRTALMRIVSAGAVWNIIMKWSARAN